MLSKVWGFLCKKQELFVLPIYRCICELKKVMVIEIYIIYLLYIYLVGLNICVVVCLCIFV